MTTILLVEDNEKLNEGNRRALEGEGYTVFCALTLEAARAHLRQNDPDIILLDVGMPDGDGFSFCEEIREQTKAHIIFLTARREHSELVQGLGLGGDDYIKKPFMLDELLARVAAAARRREIQGSSTEPVLVRGNLRIDLIANVATIDGADLGLSQKEFSVLHLLVNNEGQTMSAGFIYKSAWGQEMGSDKNAVQIVISRLRKKIEPIGYSINSVYGAGYVFEPS